MLGHQIPLGPFQSRMKAKVDRARKKWDKLTLNNGPGGGGGDSSTNTGSVTNGNGPKMPVNKFYDGKKLGTPNVVIKDPG